MMFNPFVVISLYGQNWTSIGMVKLKT